MKTINGYIKLTRPPNLIIALFSIFIGGFVTGKIEPLEKLIMACFSGLFVMAGANSINDYFDREIDKINRPSRTIPAGLVTPNQAYVWHFF